VIKLSHGWLPVGVRERRCGAATDICTQCIQPVTVPYRTVPYRTVPYRTVPVPLPLPCDLARSAHLSAQWHLVDTSTATDLQCIIVEDIQNWFLTGDTNESDTPDPIIQIGWFQVLKATYHNSGAQHKRFSSELKDFTQATIQANVDESAY
jgi:hypothetical protein